MAVFALLEDDETLASLLVESLEREGHTVNHYLTATATLEAIENEKIDIVVSDVFIKHGDKITGDGGVRLIAQLKQIMDCKIPVVAISGSLNGVAGVPVASTVTTIGADAVLAKPFHPKELLDISEKLLRKGGSADTN